MVTKLKLYDILLAFGSVLAKILMVTKPLLLTNLKNSGSVLAKILMVTKLVNGRN